MSGNLPLLIGITGHRDAHLPDDNGKHDPKALTESIKCVLQRWREKVGVDTPIWLLTGMAAGPDLLAIDAVESLMEETDNWNSQNTDVFPILPMPTEHFLKDFSDQDHESRVCFEYYLSKYKNNVVIAKPELPSEDLNLAYHDMNYGTLRNTLYLNQGAFLCRYSNVLIAVWDGKDSDSVGGTADVVKLKCGIHHMAEDAIHPSLRSVSSFDGQTGGLVHHIMVERQSQSGGEQIIANLQPYRLEQNDVQSKLYICQSCPKSDSSPLLKTLCQEFSALIPQLTQFNKNHAHDSLKFDRVMAKGLGKLVGIFTQADVAALEAQKRYRQQIKWFMCVAFLALMGYEVVSNELNTVTGLLLTIVIFALVAIAAFLIYWSKKAKHKWRYQLNRMVAEALRLRCFLNLGGVPPSTKPMMPRRYRSIFPIVTQAIAVAELIWWQKPQDLNIAEIKKHWIDDQINYLERKLVTSAELSNQTLAWLHAHPKMAMKRFSGASKLLFGLALMIGLVMLAMQGMVLYAYPDAPLNISSSHCFAVNNTSHVLLNAWCQWDAWLMLAVQFLVMLGGVIALWIELANYRASTVGFESMLVLYQKVQSLMVHGQLSDDEMKTLLNELSREAMQEHVEWNFSEEESDLAKR